MVTFFCKQLMNATPALSPLSGVPVCPGLVFADRQPGAKSRVPSGPGGPGGGVVRQGRGAVLPRHRPAHAAGRGDAAGAGAGVVLEGRDSLLSSSTVVRPKGWPTAVRRSNEVEMKSLRMHFLMLWADGQMVQGGQKSLVPLKSTRSSQNTAIFWSFFPVDFECAGRDSLPFAEGPPCREREKAYFEEQVVRDGRATVALSPEFEPPALGSPMERLPSPKH